MPQESPNPLDYMSPLWTVLIILAVLVFLLYLVAKPLHRYITDRKTEKILMSEKLGDREGAVPEGDKQGQPSCGVPEEEKKEI